MNDSPILKALNEKLDTLLGYAMGATPSKVRVSGKPTPVLMAILNGGGYTLFILLPQLILPIKNHNILILTYWSAGYFAIASFIAVYTNDKVSKIIKNDILPNVNVVGFATKHFSTTALKSGSGGINKFTISAYRIDCYYL